MTSQQSVTGHQNSKDNPTLQITTVKLNGHNYLPWSPSEKLFIKSKRKMGYITGEITAAIFSYVLAFEFM